MAKTVSEYADEIMRLIDEDIANGVTNSRGERMPATVASFSELHDYVDANEYCLTVGVPYGPVSLDDDSGLKVINAVQAEVDRRLKARTANSAPRTLKVGETYSEDEVLRILNGS